MIPGAMKAVWEQQQHKELIGIYVLLHMKKKQKITK